MCHAGTMPSVTCGTDAGYRRHLYRREPTCEPCRAAHASYTRDYYARNPDRRWSRANPEKARTAVRNWQRKNKERFREQKRLAGAMRRHGMDVADAFAALWSVQAGLCYLCGDELADDAQIDHDHRCCPHNKSCGYCRRGLACPDCNAAIARAHDDPDRLRRMADSLELMLVRVSGRLAAKPRQGMLDLPEHGPDSTAFT